MTFENFYITAPVQMLEVPIDMALFKNEDDTYMTIKEWCTSIGHEAPRVSLDGTLFVKGFPFNMAGVMEFINKLPSYGLEYGVNVNGYNVAEIAEVLATAEWSDNVSN